MKDFMLPRVSLCVTKTNQDMKNYNTPLHSEKRFIKNQSYAIAEERLAFLDGERLGDLSIGIEDNATCRKIRRIMEKRVAQNFWRNASYGKKQGNGARYETRHHVSNHFKNIFGEVPKGFRYAA